MINLSNMQNFRESFWFPLIISFVVALIGITLLGWQYHKISQEEIDSLKQNIEENSAKELVNKFMQYRIDKNGNQAMIYLTENAMEQRNLGQFILIDNFKSFKIEKTEELNETAYQFTIIIQKENDIGNFVEIITVSKNLDLNEYYIDSVQVAS